LGFDGGDRGQADAQFVHPEPKKDRHCLRVTSDSSADSGKPVMLACALDGLRDKTQKAGIQGQPSERAWDARDPSRGCTG
jgi:hypothetical protein